MIRSGSLATGGEVFVLEMGEPVKIIDLARDMIRLSGLEPERDIAIEVIGPRPGEKLHEELFNRYERAQPTPAQKIVRADHPRLDPDWEQETFDQINFLVLDGDAAALAAKVGELAARAPGAAGGPGRPVERPRSRPGRPRLDFTARANGLVRPLLPGPGREVRRLRGHRLLLRPGPPLGAVLLAGPRAEAPARMGGPRARARARARAARRRPGDGDRRAPRAADARRARQARRRDRPGAAPRRDARARAQEQAAGAPSWRRSPTRMRPPPTATSRATAEDAEPAAATAGRERRQHAGRRPSPRRGGAPPTTSRRSPRAPVAAERRGAARRGRGRQRPGSTRRRPRCPRRRRGRRRRSTSSRRRASTSSTRPGSTTSTRPASTTSRDGRPRRAGDRRRPGRRRPAHDPRAAGRRDAQARQPLPLRQSNPTATPAGRRPGRAAPAAGPRPPPRPRSPASAPRARSCCSRASPSCCSAAPRSGSPRSSAATIRRRRRTTSDAAARPDDRPGRRDQPGRAQRGDHGRRAQRHDDERPRGARSPTGCSRRPATRAAPPPPTRATRRCRPPPSTTAEGFRAQGRDVAGLPRHRHGRARRRGDRRRSRPTPTSSSSPGPTRPRSSSVRVRVDVEPLRARGVRPARRRLVRGLLRRPAAQERPAGRAHHRAHPAVLAQRRRPHRHRALPPQDRARRRRDGDDRRRRRGRGAADRHRPPGPQGRPRDARVGRRGPTPARRRPTASTTCASRSATAAAPPPCTRGLASTRRPPNPTVNVGDRWITGPGRGRDRLRAARRLRRRTRRRCRSCARTSTARRSSRASSSRRASGAGSWDGLADGEPAPPGTYQIVSSVRDQAGNVGRSAPPVDGSEPVRGTPGVSVRKLIAQPPADPVRAGDARASSPSTRAGGRSSGACAASASASRAARASATPGGVLRLKVPEGSSGLYEFSVWIGQNRTSVPFAVQDAVPEPILVVLPAATWFGQDGLDDDRDGVPNTLERGRPGRLPEADAGRAARPLHGGHGGAARLPRPAGRPLRRHHGPGAGRQPPRAHRRAPGRAARRAAALDPRRSRAPPAPLRERRRPRGVVRHGRAAPRRRRRPRPAPAPAPAGGRGRLRRRALRRARVRHAGSRSSRSRTRAGPACSPASRRCPGFTEAEESTRRRPRCASALAAVDEQALEEAEERGEDPPETRPAVTLSAIGDGIVIRVGLPQWGERLQGALRARPAAHAQRRRHPARPRAEDPELPAMTPRGRGDGRRRARVAARASGSSSPRALAATALLGRGSGTRAWSMLAALALTPVLLISQIWNTPQLDVVRDRPLIALGGGLVAAAGRRRAARRALRPPAGGPAARRARRAAVPDPGRGRRADREPAGPALPRDRRRARSPGPCRACATRRRSTRRSANGALEWLLVGLGRALRAAVVLLALRRHRARADRLLLRPVRAALRACCARSSGRRGGCARACSCSSCSRSCSSRSASSSTRRARCCSTRR